MEEQRELIFHDTVPLPLEQLEKGRKKAVRQKDIILHIFRFKPDTWMTPFDVKLRYDSIFNPELDEFDKPRILITSVRRSITDLTKENRLIKGSRDKQRMEVYKVNNNRWRYNTDYVAPINPPKRNLIEEMQPYQESINRSWSSLQDAIEKSKP